MDFARIYERGKTAVVRLLVGDTLMAKTMRGGAWLGTGSIAEQAARFARNMLLARLLAPEAFGMMAIVLSSAALVDTVTDIGVWVAIIQNPRGGKEHYLNAFWWLGMGRAILSYCIIFAMAPWIASFYGHTELSGLLRVTLLGILFSAAISPHAVLAQREMKFSRWAAITNGGGICGVILTVVLSFFVRDVWALAIGYCSENVFRCVLSYAFYPTVPLLKCDWHAARDLLTFSRGMFGLALLNLIIARADIFVLGRLYSSAALGLYAMAVSLVRTPSVFFTNMLGQTLMPALSSVQDDTERLNRILVELTSWLAVLGLPAAVFIYLSAPSLLRLAYGSRYASAGGPLAVASAVVLFTLVNAPLTCVLFTKACPALHRQSVAINAAIMLAAIYPACRFQGPVGGQTAALLAVAAGYVFQLVRLRVVTGLHLLRYGAAFVLPALASAMMLGIVLVSRRIGLTTWPMADIGLCLATAVAAFAVCASVHLRSFRRHESLYSRRTPESAAAI